jgi:hypothetical protein
MLRKGKVFKKQNQKSISDYIKDIYLLLFNIKEKWGSAPAADEAHEGVVFLWVVCVHSRDDFGTVQAGL